MFIKASSFKKMIKQAAGSGYGLHIKNDGEALWLTAPRWKMWIPKENLPNQQLGDLIATCGWLPESGEAVEIHKSGDQQVELYETIAESARDHFDRADTTYFVTRHIVYDNGWVRVLQAGDYELLRPILIDEDLFGVISPSEIDTNAGESLPMGPRVNVKRLHDDGICFLNNNMALMILPHIPNIMGTEIEHMNKQRMLRWDEEKFDNSEED